MIDLHSHILPLVDDGAVDLEMALAMGRFGVEHGLKAIAATPHFHELPSWSQIKTKVFELQQEFHKAGIDLELIAGAELLMDTEIAEMAKSEIPTFGDRGQVCLVELPLQQIPIYTSDVLFSLQTKGITPVIAHPERYAAIGEDPNLALKWLETGCLIQMNAGSILGRFGSKVQETARIMLTHQMVQLVASDAHGLERRRLNLPDAYEVLVELVGLEHANELVRENPRAILAGDVRLNRQPQEYRKKRRFFFF